MDTVLRSLSLRKPFSQDPNESFQPPGSAVSALRAKQPDCFGSIQVGLGQCFGRFPNVTEGRLAHGLETLVASDGAGGGEVQHHAAIQTPVRERRLAATFSAAALVSSARLGRRVGRGFSFLVAGAVVGMTSLYQVVSRRQGEKCYRRVAKAWPDV
jgi:hypothetical protein